MLCEDFGRYLDNYESLTEVEKNELQKHASLCAECKAELDFFLSMLSAAKSLPKIEPPADFMEKLNSRIDAEEKKTFKPDKVLVHLQKNWRQYAAVAACFALVAVITANRSALIEQIGDDDNSGIISEETVRTNDDTNGNTGKATAEAETGSISDTQTEADNAAASSDSSGSASVQAPVSESRTPSRSSLSQSNTSAAAAARAASETTVTNTSERAAAVSEKASEASVTEQTSATQQETTRNLGSDGYVIASAAIVQNSSQELAQNYSPAPSESSDAEDVKADYSLANTGETLALGMYYKIDQDGNSVYESDAPIAVGNLKISSADAEKAMEVISSYPHGENGGLYTTDSANYSLMLSSLSSNGVSYTDYTPSGNGEVQFRIVFN